MSEQRKVVTEFWPNPHPHKTWKWTARFEDSIAGPVGYGHAEQDAINDLLAIDDADNGQFGVGA